MEVLQTHREEAAFLGEVVDPSSSAPEARAVEAPLVSAHTASEDRETAEVDRRAWHREEETAAAGHAPSAVVPGRDTSAAGDGSPEQPDTSSEAPRG